MSTLVMTRNLAYAIVNLKAGWRINRVKRRNLDPYYLWDPDHSHGNNMRIDPELIKQMLKLKFIEVRPVSYSETYWRRTTHVYYATDLCKDFWLPPEEFWITHEPAE